MASIHLSSPFQDSMSKPAAPQAGKCSGAQFSAGPLSKAFSLVAIEDASNNSGGAQDGVSMSQEQPCGFLQLGMLTSQPERLGVHRQGASGSIHAGVRGNVVPRMLELSQTLSQELPPLCTPTDFATPQEQQFQVDYDRSMMQGEDEESRSPAPSPVRIQKRPRAVADTDLDTVSQTSQSQSRSQGEPSTCSKTGLIHNGKPPMHPNVVRGQHRKPKMDHPVIRNPFLMPPAQTAAAGGEKDPTSYNAASIACAPPHKQMRMMIDYKTEEKLGQGNFSEVYRVVHRMSGKRYAIKRSRRPIQSLADKNMWLAEIQALAAVEGHPNIVTYHDSWVEPADNQGSSEMIFIKMELCGESLGHSGHSSPQSAAGSKSAGQQQASVPTSSGNPCQSASHASTSSMTALPQHSGRSGRTSSHQSSLGHPVQGGPTSTHHQNHYGNSARVPMKEAELLEILRQMASALKHCHDIGLAHLDIKPDNIYRARPQVPLVQAPSSTVSSVFGLGSGNMLSSSQPLAGVTSQPSTGSSSIGTTVYKLGDFGLAISKHAPGPAMEGDARYLAPELLSGRGGDVGLDKADMFALGATMYELATGSALPTGGERYSALRQGQLMMMPCVSMKLQQLIKRLMSADPRDRPSAEQVLRSPLLRPPALPTPAGSSSSSGTSSTIHMTGNSPRCSD